MKQHVHDMNGLRTVLMFDCIHPVISQNIVQVDQSHIRGVGHAVVAGEDNIDDVREVSLHDDIVNLTSEFVNSFECNLCQGSERHRRSQRTRTYTDEFGVGASKMPCLVQRWLIH